MHASYPVSTSCVNNVTLPNVVDWSSLSASCVSFCRWVYRWDKQTGDVSPSTTYLARKQGKNKRTVYRWLSAAEAAGALTREVVQGVERRIIPLAVPPPPGRRSAAKCHRLCHRSQGQNVTGPTCNDAYTQGTQQTAECVESPVSGFGESEGFPQSQSVHAGTGEQSAPTTEHSETQAENPPGRFLGKKDDSSRVDSRRARVVGGVGDGATFSESGVSNPQNVKTVGAPGRLGERKQGCLDGAKRSVKNLETPVTKSRHPQGSPLACSESGATNGTRKQCHSRNKPEKDARAVVASLEKIGVAPKVAAELVLSLPSETALQLAALPYRSARDAAAVLVSSVRESWPVPSAFVAALDREKKRHAEEQNRALRAELSKRQETTRENTKSAFYGLSDAVRADFLARSAADLRRSMPGAWQVMEKRPDAVRSAWLTQHAISLWEGGQGA